MGNLEKISWATLVIVFVVSIKNIGESTQTDLNMKPQ
jgi:hypothetical protein